MAEGRCGAGRCGRCCAAPREEEEKEKEVVELAAVLLIPLLVSVEGRRWSLLFLEEEVKAEVSEAEVAVAGSGFAFRGCWCRKR